MADRIGNFDFIRLEEPPQLVQEQIAASTRPGTSGVTLHRLGSWAEPFECRSLAGAANLSVAIALYASYCQLAAKDPVQVTWANVQYSTLSHRFYVLGVKQPVHRRLLYGIGPAGEYFAETEATWILQPIFVG